MDFVINTHTWFVFCLLFISSLALLIFTFIGIPYVIRKGQFNSLRFKHNRTYEKYKQLEKKYSEYKIIDLKKSNQKLQVSLSDYLHQLMQSEEKAPNLIPFFSNFEKIYPDFGHSLQKMIPTISANELKLCALLRLNLSSKEVSQLLNITQESVHKARYRIRKKIGLTSKEDLFIFLLNIS